MNDDTSAMDLGRAVEACRQAHRGLLAAQRNRTERRAALNIAEEEFRVASENFDVLDQQLRSVVYPELRTIREERVRHEVVAKHGG